MRHSGRVLKQIIRELLILQATRPAVYGSKLEYTDLADYSDLFAAVMSKSSDLAAGWSVGLWTWTRGFAERVEFPA